MDKHRSSILTACLLAGGLATTAAADDGALVARVDQRIRAWQPTKAEKLLDEIGWAKDLREAFRLAQKHHRPVFLFTYSGSPDREHAMALQRC